MPQALAVTLNDGTTDVVFTPTGTNGKVLYEARSYNLTSAGFPTMTSVLDRASAKRATNKVTQTLALPIEATIDGVVSVRSIPRFFGDFVLPNDMTAAERLKFHNLVLSAVSVAIMKGYVIDLEPAY